PYASARHLHSFPTRRSSDLIYGYSLAFTEGNRFFGGFDRLFLKGATDAMAATFSKGVVLPELVFVAFQATFAAITCCLVLGAIRSEEHTSELQSLAYLVCRL